MASSRQASDTNTEDSRVLATDEGFAVGRGSEVTVIQTSDDAFDTVNDTTAEAFDTVETMASFLADIAENTQDVARLGVEKSALSERRAMDFAAQALTQQQSDMKELMDTLMNKGLPLAIAAWAVVQIWGKK
jgi:hypothetical protein